MSHVSRVVAGVTCVACVTGAWRWHHLLVTCVACGGIFCDFCRRWWHFLSLLAILCQQKLKKMDEDDDEDDEDDDELPSTAYSFLSNLMILGIGNLYGHGKNPIAW